MTTHWQDTAAKEAKEYSLKLQKPDLGILILAGLSALAIFTVGVSLGFNLSNLNAEWSSGFWQNFSTEIMGAIVTFMLFERILNRRKEADDKNSIEARQQRRLKILAGSRNNAVAVGALDEMRAEGWLHLLQDKDMDFWRANWQDAHLPYVELPEKNIQYINLQGALLRKAYLQGANLRGTNLQGAELYSANLQDAHMKTTNLQNALLRNANLQNADLQNANLEGTYLNEANLQDAHMRMTNLQNAFLRNVNLQNADLQNANLEGAFLQEAHLEGADLSRANLNHANVWGVQCDENTTLPDGSNWTETTDWIQYNAVVIESHEEWLTYLYQHNLPIHFYFLNDDKDMNNWLRKHNFIY